MDTVSKHRKIIREIIEEVGKLGVKPDDPIQVRIIIDEKNGHYLLFNDGWTKDNRRVYGCFVHIEVKPNGRVYLHYDGTDLEIGKMMLERGIPPQELVPAFNPPFMRKDMGYAVY